MLRNSFKDNPAVEGSIHFEDVVPTTPEEPADRPYLKENGEGGDLGVSEIRSTLFSPHDEDPTI